MDFGVDYTVKENLSKKPASGGITHWRDITAIQDVQNRIISEPGLYCDIDPKTRKLMRDVRISRFGRRL